MTNLVIWNGVLPEEIRRYEAHLVTEEGRAVLEQCREEANGHPLEAPGVLGRNAIPDGWPRIMVHIIPIFTKLDN